MALSTGLADGGDGYWGRRLRGSEPIAVMAFSKHVLDWWRGLEVTEKERRIVAASKELQAIARLAQENAILRARMTQLEAALVVWETGRRYTADDFSEP